MAQNIYDDPDFFAGYSRLPRQVHGLDGAPEWPTIRSVLPPLSGKRVVDLGCGFGWAARWMRQQGAQSVLGLDLSENMLARARTHTDDPAIAYRKSDLEALELPEEVFDLAYSALTFHYIADFGRLARTIHTALVAGGDLVFSIEHPVYMAADNARWFENPHGRKTWPVNRYAVEGERRTDWFARGVIKYHRRVATTLNTLIDAGFAVRRVVEFAPSAAQIAEDPTLAEELERPMMLIVSARRNREPSHAP